MVDKDSTYENFDLAYLYSVKFLRKSNEGAEGANVKLFSLCIETLIRINRGKALMYAMHYSFSLKKALIHNKSITVPSIAKHTTACREKSRYETESSGKWD